MNRRMLIVLAALYPATMPALADTDTTTFEVTATVADSCTVEADDLVFGAYDPFAGTALDEEGEVRVHCTKGTDYDIGLDEGENPDVEQRRMSHETEGEEFLDYELYSDPGRESRWGDTSGTDTVSDTGTGSVQAHPVYGRIPAEQNVEAGNYSDTISVTVSF